MTSSPLQLIPRPLRLEARQFVILTGHFFGRLFRNETVDFEDQMKERLIVVLVILAIIIGWSSNTLLSKYQFVPDVNLSWQEKSYIFTLMMIIFGIVTVLEWDVLFPDKQDFVNLTTLPLRTRTIFSAKLSSFILFIGLFSVAMTSFSSVLFSIYLTEWRANSLVLAGRYVLSHVLSGFVANFVVFFSCVFLQFVLMALLPLQLYKKASLLIRFVLIGTFVFLLLSFLVHPGIIGSAFHALEQLKASGALFIYRFPPLWFVGLYEVLLGTEDPVFHAQASTAGMAVVLALAAFAAASLLSYRRHLRKILDAHKRKPRLFGVKDAWSRAVFLVFRMTSEEKAVAGFFSNTLLSSAKHRMTFAYYLAIGAAVSMLFSLAIDMRGGFRMLSPSNGPLLALPLLVVFVLLGGIRSLANVPIASEANWIFRITETPRRDRYISGLRKAVFLKILLPFFLAVFILHFFIWTGRDAFLHAAYGMTLSLLGLELAFFRFRKIAFACTFLPGKGKLHIWGFPYAILMISLLTLAVNLEKAILRVPVRFFAFLGVSAILLVVLESWSRRNAKKRPLIYEEEPEATLVTFPENY